MGCGENQDVKMDSGVTKLDRIRNLVIRGIAKVGRKEGTCLFYINNHNTEYTSVKILSGDSH